MSLRSRYLLFLPFLVLLAAGACRSGKEATTNTTPAPSKSRKVLEKYAGILHVDESKIANVELYSFIDEWYGVPYKYGGKTKSGIDCSNFTCKLFNTVYNKPLSGTSSSIFDQCKTLSKENIKEGDLVFFKIDGNKISHVGIYLQNNKFVHATTQKGVMIDDLDATYYKKHFYKAGRLKP